MQVTLSFTNPVENVLKVTLLKLEDQKEETAATSGGQENVTQKSDGSNEGDEKKATESTEREKVKEEEKGTEEKQKSDENKKKDVAGPKKPDRTMDNSCQSRMFLPTAEVHLSVSVCYKNPGQKKRKYNFPNCLTQLFLKFALLHFIPTKINFIQDR